MMIALLLAAQTLQTPVIAKPAANPAPLSVERVSTRKQRMISDARTLVAKAQLASRNYAPRAGQPTKAELDSTVDEVKSDLDAMSEMGETESLRLQMAMDRLSKMMSTLSNMMKKLSDTQGSITNNIK